MTSVSSNAFHKKTCIFMPPFHVIYYQVQINLAKGISGPADMGGTVRRGTEKLGEGIKRIQVVTARYFYSC